MEHNIFLSDGFKAQGTVSLLGAEIGGGLHCGNAVFVSRGDVALSADNMRVRGSVFLRDSFEARGGVRLVGARIGGNLECDGGKFIGYRPTATCFDGERLLVEGHVFLRDQLTAQGQVRLPGARIAQNLDCEGGHFKNPLGIALFADGVKAGDVYLRNGFHVEGEVTLRGASIRGSLDCSKGEYIRPDGDCLSADGINVRGSVFLADGLRAEGRVSLRGAEIAGQLDFGGATLVNKGKQVIAADDIAVHESLFMNDGFTAEGEVCLHGATVEGGVECQGGTFSNPGAHAIGAYGATIRDNLLLSTKFGVQGTVCLKDARIGGELRCSNIRSNEGFGLDLRSARIGTLSHDETGWPRRGRLFLDGLVYDRIDQGRSAKWRTWVRWIRLQPPAAFSTQPYEQLAAVFRRSGQSDDAERVLIAKARDRASFAELAWPRKVWYYAFGKLVGYGYRPWRAAWIGLIVILIGSILFSYGYSKDIITPTQERAYARGSGLGSTRSIAADYPKFDPFLYSVDMFVPVVTFHHATYWLPNANRGDVVLCIAGLQIATGALLRYYLAMHILMGWVLTTLLIVGLTGLIRA